MEGASHPPMSKTYLDYGSISFEDSDSLNARKNAKFVKVTASITEICDNAFQNSSIEEIIFEEGSQLESIGEQAFNLCKNLKSIKIPPSVRTINMDAFSHSTLERIDFAHDSRLEAIDYNTFEGCKFLKSIMIPASVTTIASGSFSDSGLVEVSFAGKPKLQVIHCDMFRDCNSLKVIKLPSKSIKIIGNLFSLPSFKEIIFGNLKQIQIRDEYFIQLCQEGDVSKCEEYYNNNNINIQYKLPDNDDKPKTALDVAISRVLGSDCEWVDKSIFNCIRYGNERMAIKLLDLGADLSNIFVHRTCGSDRITMSRFTLLSYACKYQGITLVKELVERGIPVNRTMIDILGEDGITDTKSVITNTDRDTVVNVNNEMDIGVGEDDDNDDNDENVENDWDRDDKDDIDGAPESETETVENTSSVKSIKFFYTSREIHRTVGNNPWFIPYFCRKTMNRNKDIPDYNEIYEFDQQGDLFLLSMTPLGVSIHHEKVEIISFLLERGADSNSTIMDIPTIYNINTIIMDEFCTRYDSAQETDYEFTHEYGIWSRDNILDDSYSNSKSEDTTAKKNLDGLKDILLEKDEYCYDENWESELVCQFHQSQPQNQQDQTLASKHVDTKHGRNNNNIMDDQSITLSNPSHLTFKSTRGKIISLLLQYGLDILSLVKSETISIESDEGYFEFNFDDIRVGFYNDADLLFSIKKCVTSEIMQKYVSRFLEKLSVYLDDDQFFYHLLLLLRYGLAEEKNKETIIQCFSRHMAVESIVFIAFVNSGMVSKESLHNELADIIIRLASVYFSAFKKYTKLYPDLFSITFETPEGTLSLGNDIISKYKLLQLGLNINHRTKAGDTLLLHSLKSNMLGSFRVLLSLGADIHLVDQDGKSIEELFMLGRVDCESSTKVVFEKHLHLLTLLVKMNAYQDNLCICGDVKSEDDKVEDKQMDEMIDGEKNKNDNGHNHHSSLSTHVHVLVQPTSVQPSPFTLDECALIQSSHVPGYTTQTLSYFLSKSIVDDVDTVCVYCNNKFKANDHCRPMLMSVDNSNNAKNVENAENTEIVKNVVNVEKFIHNICFHKSNLQDPNIWTKDLKDSICYIVNPTKPLTPRYA